MKVQINTLNLKMTDHIREQVNDKLASKLDKLVKSFNQDLKLVDVKIDKQSDWGYKVRVNLELADHSFFADTRHESLVSGLVDAREKLETQIKKFKEKLKRY
ncbi:MAG: hypothetical protein GF381_03105 [Candidatus Pacebacteria bacterium]|nr:hypothetical protein [Candidatus Paceibacterota bacterium]